MTGFKISSSVIKTLDDLQPKHRGQVAYELVRLAAGKERSDVAPLKGRGTQRITVGEYRVEIWRSRDGLEVTALHKRNDGYRP